MAIVSRWLIEVLQASENPETGMIHRLFVQVNTENCRRIAHIVAGITRPNNPMIIIALTMILFEIFFAAKASTRALMYRSFSGQEMICPYFIDRRERVSYIPGPDMHWSQLFLCRDQEYEESGYPMRLPEFGHPFYYRGLRNTGFKIIRYVYFVKITKIK
jgi:hypothetical protein